jgi:hypothetical protein
VQGGGALVYSDAELRDFAAMARRTNQRSAALRNEALPSLDLMSIAGWVRRNGGASSFAQSRLVDRGGLEPVLQLQFASAPPPGLENFLTRFGFDTEIVVGAALSEVEVDKVGLGTGRALQASAVAQDQYVVGLNQDGTAYTITVSGSDVDAAVAEDIVADVQASLTADLGRTVPVEVIADPNLVPVEFQAAVQGGRKMTRTGDGAICTTGFSVTRSGNNGVVTAGHCTNMNRYMDTANVLEGGAVATPDAGYIDLKFYRTLAGHTTPPEFYVGAAGGGLRTLNGYANVQANTNVFAYGLGSFYRSGQVISTNICTTISGTYTCGLDQVQVTSYGGDSGGPYFVGGVGHGSHSAGSPSSPYSFMTRIGRVANNLGATVKTG